jgi:nucleotide-binding universal stress UspA family protein
MMLMVRHVLVPLDGSSLAESALPAAAATAAAFEARITLFHVLEEWAPETVHGHPHLTDGEQAQAYLAAVARRPILRDRQVDMHVHQARTGNVADSIMAHADELGADLVVLSTHGQGGLKGLLVGSIALRALTRGRTPILLVNPTATGQAPPFVCRKILVPLDGTAAHEPSLPMASRLAHGWGAALHLVVVVPTTGTLSGHLAATGVLMPRATRAMLDMAEREAQAYVKGLSVGLGAQGLSSTWSVSRGEPVGALVDAAQTAQADLVVMATHARRALEGFWSGSLTPKLMQRMDRPMLLVRAEGHDEAR